MKRQNRFIIGILAAGITFATLTATVGTDHWKRGHYFHHGYYHHHDHHDNDDQDNLKSEDSGGDTGKDNSGSEI